MKKTKQILFLIYSNKSFFTFVLVLFAHISLYASYSDGIVTDSISCNTITSKETITGQVIYTTSDGVLYNTENVYTYTKNVEAKIAKIKKTNKRKLLYSKTKNKKTYTKFAKLLLKTDFKEIPNDKYFAPSFSYNIALHHDYKYTIRLCDSRPLRLINRIYDNIANINYKNHFQINFFLEAVTVRPPPLLSNFFLI